MFRWHQYLRQMKIRLDENNSIEFSESCEVLLERGACGMLSEEFEKIANPFIQYDKKRMATIGARCDFGYSKKMLMIMKDFGNSPEALHRAVSDFSKISGKLDIKNFIIEKCQIFFQLHSNCFAKDLENTDFFKESLRQVKRLGAPQKINDVTNEKTDASDDEIANALAIALQKIIKYSVLESLESTKLKIKETKTTELQKYCEKLERKNEVLKVENEALKATAAAPKSRHSDLILESMTIGIDIPSAMPEAASAAATQSLAKKGRRKSV